MSQLQNNGAENNKAESNEAENNQVENNNATIRNITLDKRPTTLKDGRYLIYYTFKDSNQKLESK